MAEELYRLVWTRTAPLAAAGTIASEPLARDAALARFDSSARLLLAASLGQGRLKVISDADYRAGGGR